MSIKLHNYFLVSLSLCAAVHVTASANDDMIAAVSPYVYPSNKAKAPQQMHYLPDGESYLALADDGKSVGRYDIAKGTLIETVLDVNNTRGSKVEKIEGMSLSANGGKILLYTDSSPIYRHSFKARYYVFEISRNILKPLSENHEMQQSPVFSPDGRMVAFVADNNIFIKKLDYDNEVPVTSDGKENSIINGIPDWTYQEEFATQCSMSWAPDNTALSYIKYDEEAVPLYGFPIYEGACEANADYALYPGYFSYKYPVAGKPNSKIAVYSYDISNRTTKKLALPTANAEYIPRISYAGSAERLMVVTLNRAQNKMEIYDANPKSTVARSILTETSKEWINPSSYEQLDWQDDGFVMQSPRDGYNHLYRYAYNGTLQRRLTSGEWNVTAYYGKDASGNHFFQSTSSGPLNRVVSKIDSKGKKTDLTANEGFSSASFSPDMAYCVVNFNDISTPPVYSLRLTKNNKELRVLEANDSLREVVSSLPEKEFFTFQSDGVALNGYMIKPTPFDSSKKYPVIMWQYSGPGSQEVLNRWSLDWEAVAAMNGFGVVCVDGRGTGGRNRDFETVVYKNLGKYETIDQINAARYVASLSWVDSGNIGIAGWSYGGYESLMCASATGDNPFKAAVAIAPVTDWRYYDTVYAERYMLTPSENEDGYDSSAPINHVSSLSCPILIMSGTADDNVHLSNTMEYVARMVAEKKSCDMMLFPNMNHSINGCGSRSVVYGKMLEFFNRQLKK